MRPLRKVFKSVRMTEGEEERFAVMMGYRGLWTWADLILAGLDLLASEYARDSTPAPPPRPEAPPVAKPNGRKKR